MPPRFVKTGVDMGRAFSVFLFCIGVDPVLTVLNRIPGVITVQGYIDDTPLLDVVTRLAGLTLAGSY